MPTTMMRFIWVLEALPGMCDHELLGGFIGWIVVTYFPD